MDPFLGEVRIFGFDFQPRGWALCDGQLMPVKQNQALFTLLGKAFGGDGVNNFALPDLRGRVAVGVAENAPMGKAGGFETIGLTSSQMPAHSHPAKAFNQDANQGSPGNGTFAATQESEAFPIYATEGSLTAVDPGTVAPNFPGTVAPHSNMQPYLVTSYAIALTGAFPLRS
ncbi:phage tail protein [Solimonas sp. SE-A11]|uniref:phage tail protein n=1 Tax=Solimonas sp. SE-A11 TaxID=3054954 RepID=UPI00259D179E|nr:tail fiber protein [Solimonas sp. SE-A11]MDM4772592.1 tail fiber protein [Solimonas sp. SE-A11]